MQAVHNPTITRAINHFLVRTLVVAFFAAAFPVAAWASPPSDLVLDGLRDRDVVLELTDGATVTGTVTGYDSVSVAVILSDGRVVEVKRTRIDEVRVSTANGTGRAEDVGSCPWEGEEALVVNAHLGWIDVNEHTFDVRGPDKRAAFNDTLRACDMANLIPLFEQWRGRRRATNVSFIITGATGWIPYFGWAGFGPAGIITGSVWASMAGDSAKLLEYRMSQ